MIINKIIDSGLIQENSYIIVGLSGGPDSLCLLHALVQIAEPYNLNIVPVHVNHKLRAAADEEADNVARICDVLDLECLMFEADCQGMADELGISTEEAGRNIRYEIFDDVAKDLRSQGIDEEKIFIAVAHNADDQSETVLFRLIRGTGIHGLAGIPEIRLSEAGFMIIRPLLKAERSDIEAYINANNLHPNIDESNKNTDYTRNKIRNELIPYLEKNFNPNVREALRRFAEIADVDDSVMQDIAYNDCEDALFADHDKEALVLDITDIRNNPPAINRRIVALVFKMLKIDALSSYELVIAILNLIYTENPSAKVDLPEGFKAIREYDQIVFTDNEEYLESAKPDENLMLLPQVMMKKEFQVGDDEVYAAFDFDEFNKKYPGKIGEIVLRTRREGDYIAIKGGKKKLQDFLVDSKIRKNVRDSLLMACIENEILWILPNNELSTENQRKKGKFSQNFQIGSSTERVLFLEVETNL